MDFERRGREERIRRDGGGGVERDRNTERDYMRERDIQRLNEKNRDRERDYMGLRGRE